MTDSATLNAAAQRLAVERLEQVRSAEWQYYSGGVNRLTNFQGVIASQLVLPLLTNTPPITANVFTDVQSISTNPPVQLIRVRCVWTSLEGQTITNEVSTLRGPD
jgi:hypothetical protein